MVAQIVLVALPLLTAALTISIYNPPDTNIVTSVFQSEIEKLLPSDSRIHFQNIDSEVINEQIVLSSSIIINLSTDIQASIELERLASVYQIAYFGRSVITSNDLNFQLEYSWEEQSKAIITLLTSFGWNNFIYFSQVSQYADKILARASQYFEFTPMQYKEIPISTLDLTIGRIVKAGGIKFIFIYQPHAQIEDILNSMVNNKIYGKQRAVISYQNFIRPQSKDGEIIITPSYAKFASSYEQSLAQSLIRYFGAYVEDATFISFANKYRLINVFQEQQAVLQTLSKFDIINIQTGNLIISGVIEDDDIRLDKKLIYPGNISTPPTDSKTEINISSSLNSWDPVLSPQSNGPIYYKAAEIMALDFYNRNSTYLEYFNLDLYDIKCGQYGPIEPFTRDCIIENVENFGLYYSATVISSMTQYHLDVLASQNVFIPSVGSMNTAPYLGNQENYPNIVLVPTVQDVVETGFVRFLTAMHIKELCIITTDSWINTIENQTIKTLESVGINITNKNLYYLKPEYVDNPELMTEMVQNIISTQSRYLYCFLHFDGQKDLIAELIAQNVQPQDIILIYIYGNWQDIAAYEDDYTEQRRKILAGTISVYAQANSGFFAEYIREHADEYNTPLSTASCHAFDGFTVMANSIDYTIKRGLDYQDGRVLDESTRKTRFQGCTGLYKVSDNSNYRQSDSFSLFVSLLDEQGKLNDHLWYQIRLSSSKIADKVANIIYPTGSDELPVDNRRIYFECVANEKEFEIQLDSIQLSIGLQFGITIIATLLSIFIIWRWKHQLKHDLLPVTEQQELSFGDLTNFGIMIIEFGQLIALAPKRVLPKALIDLLQYLLVDITQWFDLSNGLYQQAYNTILAVVGTLDFIILGILFKMHEKDNKFNFLNRIMELFARIFSLYVQAIVLPAAILLNSVFMCYEAEKNTVEDTVFDVDCTEYCWTGNHLTYVVIICIMLFIFQIVVMTSSSYMQSLIVPLNVGANFNFLVSKQVLKFILAAASKPLTIISDNTFSITYLIIISIYTGYLFKITPFNYPRTVLWQRMLFIFLIFIELLRLLMEDYEPHIPILIMLGGIIILSTIALIIQSRKMPSYLFRVKGVKIELLFRFQLSNKSPEEMGISSNHLAFANASQGAAYEIPGSKDPGSALSENPLIRRN